MIIDSHNHDKLQKCQDYIQSLEEEKRKIQVFQRELPLCLELVTQAIETCRNQLSGTVTECNINGQSEISEQTSSDDNVPAFEEFIPLKGASSSDGEEQDSKKQTFSNDKSSKKSDWLRSVQLWNQTPDPPLDSPRKVAGTEVKRSSSGGGFQPFKKDKSGGGAAAPPLSKAMPAAGSGGGNKKEEKEGQSQRKSRRCWSPELHRRFLDALQQLGGSYAATPKQIRELMKVDGLTNDEVKSHLQKYRLHTRRPNPSVHNNNNNNTQTPQFVVMGGIWMPPEYVAMATTTTSGEAVAGSAASKGIYAPIAAPPPQFKESKQKREHNPSHSDDRGSNNHDNTQSHSPAISSSTHTNHVS